MNIFKSAAKACRPFFLALPAISHLISRAASRQMRRAAPALESALETIAHVLCVESRGVMVCGASGGSVAHLQASTSSPAH